MTDSLADYAASNPLERSAHSWLTTIPEHDEVVAAWGNGVAAGVIRKWLVEQKGYPPEIVTETRVGGFLRRVHPR